MQLTSHTEGRVSGYKSYLDGDSWDIVSNDPDPAEQVAKLMDMPDGESVEDAGQAAIRRLFEVVATDLRGGRKDPIHICRRLLALGHRVGALRDYTLQDIADAMKTSRQAVCQNANLAERLVGREFAREPQGRAGGRRKS